MKLYNEDCLIAMDRMIAEGVKVDAIITDPPYGTTACKWDSVIPFIDMWEHLNRIIKPNGAIVLFGSEPFSSLLRCSNLKMFKYDWIWDKKRISCPMLAKKQPLRQHEVISVFYKTQCVYNYQPYIKNTIGNMGNQLEKHTTDTQGDAVLFKNKGNNNKTGYPRTILNQIPVLNNLGSEKIGLHPTQKPIKLMEYLIKTYTNEGETVLDFTMGSGTTGVACVNTNRNFIGIELDETYFNIAEERIEKHTTQQRLFKGDE